MSTASSIDPDTSMRVLQAGLAKSGNFWLYKILQHCFREAGLPRESFIQKQPIHDVAQNWELSYEEQADIDVLDITDQGHFYRISSIFRHPVLDLEEYLEATTHVWTHSFLCDASWDVLPQFDKTIYIVRDPRDAALSHARFMLTPYMKTYYPNDVGSVDEYLETRLESKLERWVRHVGFYLAHAERLDIHVVFYERFLLDFRNQLDRLLDYLGLPLAEEQRKSIHEAVTFQAMKEKDPEHVRKGKAGKWRDQMTEAQKRRSAAVAGPLMDRIGYPLERGDGQIRPGVPDQITASDVENMLERARHPYVKDRLKKGIRRVYRTFLP
jgi:aryl sulfotransferase